MTEDAGTSLISILYCFNSLLGKRSGLHRFALACSVVIGWAEEVRDLHNHYGLSSRQANDNLLFTRNLQLREISLAICFNASIAKSELHCFPDQMNFSRVPMDAANVLGTM